MYPRVVCRAAVTALLALIPAFLSAQGQGATIRGRITTEAGLPVRSANVFLQELSIGTQTAENGQYVISVPAAQARGQTVTLTVRALGYRVATQPLTLSAGEQVRNFTLAANPLRLGEVVVTGAGTESSTEKLGTSISSVKAADIERSNEANVVTALAAKAPGVVVSQGSGEPGAATFIQIRGAKSIEGVSQPLFVVDGLPVDNSTILLDASTAGTVATNRMADLNPADIESVEILKGAAASAIYGARAGGGVVLITTKRGRAGQTRYSLRSSISVDEVNRRIPLQRRFGQGLGGVSATCAAANCAMSPFSFGAPLAAGTQTFDHFGEMFRQGGTIDNSLSISGGNDRTTFYLSAGRMDQEGTIIGPNNWYDRTTLLLKGTHALSDRFTLGANFQYADSRGAFIQKGSNLSGLLLGALRTPPEFDNRQYRTETGLHRSYRSPRPTRLVAARGYDNPFFVVNEQTNTAAVGRAFGNVNMNYTPLQWLNIKYTLGADYSSDDRVQVTPQSSSNDPTGIIDRGNFITYQIDHNLIATASKDFGSAVNTSLTLGQNLNHRRFTQFQMQGRGFIAPDVNTLNNTNPQNLIPSEYKSLVRIESYFAEGKADIGEQLFLTAGVRNDASSTFGPSVRRNWFPKASAAWNFTRTLGMSETGVLSFGKLRSAYGEVGREPAPYQIYSGFQGSTVGDGWGPFYSPSQAGNGGLYTSLALGQERLRPERTRETEVGADFGFFNQIADLAVTYYDSKSTDVILQVPLARSTGYSSQLQNAATITNRGMEVAFNIRPLTRDNVALTLGAQWARNRNRVEQITGAEFLNLGGGFLGNVVAGHAHSVFYDYDFVRCRYGQENTIEGVDINAACQAASAPNGAMYIGADGFPLLDPNLRIVGDPNPDWTGNVNMGLTLFKKLNVSALLDVRQGGDVWNGTRGALYHFGTHRDTEIRGEQRTFGSNFYPGPVVGPGAGRAVTIGQSWFTGNGSGFNGPSTTFIEDGSFTKLREISLGYTFDQAAVRRLTGMSSVDVRVSGRNLAIWTDYSGIDPEANLGGNVPARGNDYFNNPLTRSYVFTFSFNR